MLQLVTPAVNGLPELAQPAPLWCAIQPFLGTYLSYQAHTSPDTAPLLLLLHHSCRSWLP